MFLICKYLFYPEINKVGNQRMSIFTADVMPVIASYADVEDILD